MFTGNFPDDWDPNEGGDDDGTDDSTIPDDNDGSVEFDSYSEEAEWTGTFTWTADADYSLEFTYSAADESMITTN